MWREDNKQIPGRTGDCVLANNRRLMPTGGIAAVDEEMRASRSISAPSPRGGAFLGRSGHEQHARCTRALRALRQTEFAIRDVVRACYRNALGLLQSPRYRLLQPR